MEPAKSKAYIDTTCALASNPGTFQREAAQLRDELCDRDTFIGDVLHLIDRRPASPFESYLQRQVSLRLAA